jgi:hypothetical protein
MVGSKTGLVGHLERLGVKCVFLHCIIHQEVLCGKITKKNLTTKMVVNIVSLIFAEKIKFKDIEHSSHFGRNGCYCGDIPLHPDVRWLSEEKCSQRFLCAKKRNSSVSSN